MSKRNRNTLKNYFKNGALPSEEHFADLIDSGLNMVDEGFSKSPDNGFEVVSHGDHDNLMTFFKGMNSQNATWSISHASDSEILLFGRRSDSGNDKKAFPSLALAPEGKIGVNTAVPQCDLDVKGVIRAEGRVGCNPNGNAIPADGKWHDISGTLYGCQAFEVLAGVGKHKTGKYALLHAVAVNAYNPSGFFFNLFNLKKHIRCTQSYYKSRADKLKLRWQSVKDGYCLEMRSNANYGEGVYIRFHLTRLWHDPLMDECLEKNKE